MYTKVKITGMLETVTGLPIGTGGAFSPIGSADSPVVRDALNHRPMIPGSSLKGKIRTLLSRSHTGSDCKVSDDPKEITDLFGSQKGRSKVLFSDLFLNEAFMQRLESMDIYSPTEVKFENSINRLTAVANPRQIERVIRGAQFDLEIICEAANPDELEQNVQLLAEGLKSLCFDYLGGNGSRGYGKVKFSDLKAETVIGDIPDDSLQKCNAALKGAELI